MPEAAGITSRPRPGFGIPGGQGPAKPHPDRSTTPGYAPTGLRTWSQRDSLERALQIPRPLSNSHSSQGAGQIADRARLRSRRLDAQTGDTAARSATPATQGRTLLTIRAHQRQTPQRAKPGDGTARPANERVRELLRIYGAKPKVARPVERILTWAARVQEAVARPVDTDGLIDNLIECDIRRQVFLLEGILKLYKKRYGDAIKGQYRVAKQLEDSLGAYKYELSMAARGRELDLPGDVQAYLDHRVEKRRKKLADILEKKWIPESGTKVVPAIRNLIDDLSSIEWDKPGKDLAYVRSELTRRLSKIEKTDYDMKKLDKGLHELRRQLRWLPIYAEALDGLMVLDETSNPLPAYEALLKTPLASSKYLSLPPPKHEPAPCLFSKSLYAANMRLVLDLGDLKDQAETIKGLAKAFDKADVINSRKKARRKVIELMGKPKDALKQIHEEAEQLYSQMRRVGLLPSLCAEIRDKLT